MSCADIETTCHDYLIDLGWIPPLMPDEKRVKLSEVVREMESTNDNQVRQWADRLKEISNA